MEIKKINEKEYEKYIKGVKNSNFFQSIEWAKFKSLSEWNMDLIGFYDGKKLVGVASLLSRNLPFVKKKMYYCPRGYVTDYSNFELIKEITVELKKYLKENNGLFIKINPYIEYQKRDKDGNPVGEPNDKLIELLKNNGYHHYGFYKRVDEKKDLEPRWLSSLDLENKSVEELLNNFRKTTRWRLNKSEKNCISLKEATKDDLKDFKKIMVHTSERREFEDRPLSYYESMYDELRKSNMIRVLIAEIDFLKLFDQTDEEINRLKIRIDEIKDNPKKQGQVNEFNKQIEAAKKKEKELNEFIEKYGNTAIISAGLYISYGDQIIYLFGGSYKEFMEFGAQYLMQYEMIKYAKENNFKQLNFYGIDGDFDEKSPGYGLFDFKRGFNADVIELIGEFDLVENKSLYKLYNMMFKTYKGAKKIKRKIKR
jgi:lipid II:glycine glycyltransferase (peptidoglycan interpeptide bridge formation enzyme)